MSPMFIQSLVNAHEQRRLKTVNLVASENLMSYAALAAMRSDLNNRYCMPREADRPSGMWDYPNQAFTRQITSVVENYACKIFGGRYADVRPLSGNNVAYIVLKSLVPLNGNILSVPAEGGGHFTTSEICRVEGIKQHSLPFNRMSGQLDLCALAEIKKRVNPDLVFLDASMQSFPYPLSSIRDILGDDVIISYDASHTMGLIAGGEFQDPFSEGADLLHGSTHKTFFGPQKGIIVCKNPLEHRDGIAARIRGIVSPLFVSNMHIHNVAALGVAFEEMFTFGSQYAKQVIRNAKTFASSLHNAGGVVLYADRGYTENHQVLCRVGTKAQMQEALENLENAHIHANGIQIPFETSYGLRFGLAEITRRGMTEPHASILGTEVANSLFDRKSCSDIAGHVTELSRAFSGITYCQSPSSGAHSA